jgi:hypothetical protein
VEPFPPEVDAGATVGVRARVSCSGGCDLSGGRLQAACAGEIVSVGDLAGVPDAAGSVEVALTLEAPPRVGDWVCSFQVPELDIAGVFHDEARLEVTCRVLPHATSLAVWGVPLPLAGGAFAVSVGVKCAVNCSLRGLPVQVLDEGGSKVGQGALGGEPYAGTSALYAADVALVAPREPGLYACSVLFAARDTPLPHLDASGSFTFRCLEPPEHTVSVRVVPKNFEPQKRGIEVRLGAYRGETDVDGVARIAVPKGSFEVSAWRIDLEATPTRVEVTCDSAVEVVVEPRRVVDHDAERWG